MIILHPYGDTRKEDQKETWEFLRTQTEGFEVVSRNVTGQWGYVEFVKEYWGSQDLIVLEDDKVPTRADLIEMVTCPRPYCCFPHSINFQLRTTMKQWTERFPYTTGFVKFTKGTQRNLMAPDWGPFFYGAEKRPSIDRAIEQPLIRKFGPMHLHPRFIRHNHKPTMKLLTKQWGAKSLTFIEGPKF